jgi:hypothetical protein
MYSLLQKTIRAYPLIIFNYKFRISLSFSTPDVVETPLVQFLMQLPRCGFSSFRNL